MFKYLVRKLLGCLDVFFVIPVVLSGFILGFYRKCGSSNLRWCTLFLRKIGVFPIIRSYYEPFLDLHPDYWVRRDERRLNGIDFQLEHQEKLLDSLIFADEVSSFVSSEKNKNSAFPFFWGNGNFESGDAEFLYQFVRYFRPKRVLEIGCGFSSILIAEALDKNAKENGFRSNHTCVEPFEMPLLETLPGVSVKRCKVEDLGNDIWEALEPGDLLFIDSSHVIRPAGDVLKIYLEIIPNLKSGVFIHCHDIFSPRDYPAEWLIDKVLFWNEQYLLEALLTDSSKYEVVAALNQLKHRCFAALSSVCPFLTVDREPGSFYFKKL